MAQKRNSVAGGKKSAHKNESSFVPLLGICIAVCAVCIILVAIMAGGKRQGTNDTGTGDDSAQSGSGTSLSSGASGTANVPDVTDGAETPPQSDAAPSTDGTTSGSDTSVPDTAGAPGTSGASDTNSGETTASPASGVNITTKKSTFDDNGAHVTMIYPTVSGIDGADTVTGLLRDEMDERRREALIGMAGGEVNYTVEDTSVKLCTKSFMSLVVSGYSYVGDASHPEYFVYALNYDIKSKKLMTGSDLIKDFDAVKSSFTSGKFFPMYSQDGLLDEMTYEDMIMEYHVEYGIYPEVYYTKDNFGIAVELVYSLGGYALFETSQSSLSGAIYVPQN